MATNVIDEGTRLPVILTAAVTVNQICLMNNLFGLALESGGIGDAVTLQLGCHCVLPKVSANTFAVGAYVYWDDTNKRTTSTASGNKLIGIASTIAANGDAAVKVRLNPAF